MKPKDLYIVSEQNVPHLASEIREIRLKVIEAIARTIKNGGYFEEGISEEHASFYNAVLKSVDEGHLQGEGELTSGHEPEGESSVMHDMPKSVGLLKGLRKEGFNFDYKHTEDCPQEEGEKVDFFLDDLFEDPELCILAELIATAYPEVLGDADKLLTLITKENEVLGEVMAELVRKRFLRSRDEQIVKNVEKKGEGRNILFVGLEHELETLHKCILVKAYRLDVRNVTDEIWITGRIPEEFRRELEHLPEKTKSGIKVDKLSLDYDTVNLPWNFIHGRGDTMPDEEL